MIIILLPVFTFDMSGITDVTVIDLKKNIHVTLKEIKTKCWLKDKPICNFMS